MKRIIFILLILMLPLLNFGQSIKDSLSFQKTLLYNQFINGSVLMKSGAIENASLNYNTENQAIVFIKDSRYMIMTGTELVDTIYIGDKKFVPAANIICEVVATGPIALYLSYHNHPRPVQATTDYNGTSRKESNQVSNTVTDVYATKLFRGNYNVEILKNYWLKMDDKFHKANTIKQFLKPFSSDKRSAIEKYVETDHIDFNKESDLIKLVGFCNEKFKP
jgi:hypothetical protein